MSTKHKQLFLAVMLVSAVVITVFISVGHAGNEQHVTTSTIANQAYEQRTENGVQYTYDRNGRKISPHVSEETTTWDYLVGMVIGLVAITAYWKGLGIIIKNPSYRVIAFVLSLPFIAYAIFAYYLGKGLHAF